MFSRFTHAGMAYVVHLSARGSGMPRFTARNHPSLNCHRNPGGRAFSGNWHMCPLTVLRRRCPRGHHAPPSTYSLYVDARLRAAGRGTSVHLAFWARMTHGESVTRGETCSRAKIWSFSWPCKDVARAHEDIYNNAFNELYSCLYFLFFYNKKK